MLKVEIDQNQTNNVQERSGNTNGRDWKIRTQSIYTFVPGSKYPIEINFNLPDGVQSYPPGQYTLDVESAITQGNYNSIFLNTRQLFLQLVNQK